MCKLLEHDCIRCKETYTCPYPNWVCATINDDDDANMCDNCLDKVDIEMGEWERNNDV